MSSGWNGIPIKRVGKTRYKLAEMLCQLTGALILAEDIQRTNPINQHYEDCCAWDCLGTLPADTKFPTRKIHIYSWDTMKDCVKYGVVRVGNRYDDPWDFEVCANQSKEDK